MFPVLGNSAPSTLIIGRSLSVLQSLCCEIKQRRRGVASILRLCQHLLDDGETCNLNADHQPMQLIIVNLERRWEAIVMQAVQWQTRLQRKMGKESVSDYYYVFKHNGLSFYSEKKLFQGLEYVFTVQVVLLTKGIVISSH